jgi:adenosylmethionine---8-amino-7-oxononanoate aminotransferase
MTTPSLAERDHRFVWHPFTPMQDWLQDEPVIIERGEGAWLVDTKGRRYLDGVSSLWTNVHGHHRREIDDAVRAQLDRVAHSTLLGLANVPSIELAERLIELAPAGLARVFYSDSGSTAVEVALKLAFQYFQQSGRPEKRRFLALTQAYHGDTLGAVAVGGIDLFHQIFHPLLFQVERVAPSAAALEALLRARGHEIAAFVLEPLIQGAAGMLRQPPGFLHRAAQLCRDHDVLLIADEVATGFGRTGTMFACEQEHVQPDLLCLAKGLTGGYLPLAATLATEAVFGAFLGAHAQQRTFFHGHTYTGNPLACAAALASLEIFARDRVLDRLPPLITHLARALATAVAPLPHVAEVRQLGLMVGIELQADPATHTPYPDEVAVGARVCRAIRRHGVLLRPLGPVVVLMPPLCITAAEVDLLVHATATAISEVTAA